MDAWGKEFSGAIARLRKDYFAPIDQKETELLEKVDEAFAQIGRGNAGISNLLSSLRKVQESQDSMLEKARMADLRIKINTGIAELSKDLSQNTDRIDAANRKVEELKKKLKQ